jgi:sulfoxide reductase catalytic subunit YedY
MSIRPPRIAPSQITPAKVFFNRRAVLAGALGASVVAALPRQGLLPAALAAEPAGRPLQFERNSQYSVSETPNRFADITGYNNFYEFGTDKEDPQANAQKFRTAPWSVTVVGEAEVTGKFTLEDILKPHPLEERIYRFRCVEAWSMVIPWVGFPLRDLLARFKPTSKARCPGSGLRSCSGRTSRVCESMRRCIR